MSGVEQSRVGNSAPRSEVLPHSQGTDPSTKEPRDGQGTDPRTKEPRDGQGTDPRTEEPKDGQGTDPSTKDSNNQGADPRTSIPSMSLSLSTGRADGQGLQAPPSAAAMPSLLPIRISTWNTNGLFGQPVSADAGHRLRLRRKTLAELAAASDIVCLQEVHGSAADLAELRTTFPLWSAFGSFCDARAAGGVVVLISKVLAANFTSIVDFPLVEGRIHRVMLDGPLGSLNVICVHSNPRLADALRVAEFRAIAKTFKASDSTISMVIGDFNAPAPAEERFDMLLQKWTTSDQRLATAIENAIDRLTEVTQPDFTRVGMEGGVHRFFSRIDRLFTDMPTIDILDSQPFGRTTCDPAAANFPSDHCPVTFVFRRLGLGPPDRVVLPPWLTKLPQYHIELNSLLSTYVFDHLEPLSSHNELKELIHMAAAATRKAIANVEPESAEHRVYIAMKAARSIRRKDVKGLQKALDCFKALRDIFGSVAPTVPSDVLVAQLHDLLQLLSVQVLEDEAKQLNNERDKPSQDRDSKRAKIDTRLRLWRSHSRKAAFSAVCSNEGECLTSLPDMSKALHRHWQGVFDEKPIDDEAAEALVANLRLPTLEALTIPDVDDINRYITTVLKDSAPGPDGIPYSAWQATGIIGATSIRAVLQHVLDGGSFPEDASASLMVFISKVGGAGIVAKADEMRPISLTNTDAKMWASLINFGLSRALELCIDPVQKGFVRGRRGSDHVIELDARSYGLSLQYHDPALLLADLRAAFPSLSHNFIKKVLVRLLGTHPFFRAIMLMYKDLVAVIVLAGMFLDTIVIKSGLRQGCPLSGTIFAICFQAWTAHVEHHAAALPRGGTMWLYAFADDIAIALAALWDSLGFLASMFEVLAAATCLVLNAKKTIVIPLWRSANLEAVATRAAAGCTIWKGIVVALVGKYLGVQVGPLGHVLNMSSQIREYRLRCRTISLLGGGWAQALHLHNIVAMPVTSYILQFYKAPATMASIEMPAIAILLGTPNMAISPAAVRHLQLFKGIKNGFPSMTLLSRASLARVWLQLENAEAIHSELKDIVDSDDSFYRAQHPGWQKVVFINTLRENFVAIHSLVPALCPPRGAQSRIYNILRLQEADEPLVSFAARRLATLFRRPPASLRFTAKFAIANLTAAANVLPLVHLAGFIRVLSNAVISSARMGRDIENCRFCNALASDDVRHWGCCSEVANIANFYLPRLGFSPCPIDPLDSVLGAFPVNTARASGFVILADILVFAHAHKRHGDSASSFALAGTRLRMLVTSVPRAAAIIDTLCNL
jgi:endonuclease/exonuclease/phosphatase family metal-dependent hydrolase